VRREREGACPRVSSNPAGPTGSSQVQGQINLWGARDNIQTGNANTVQVAQDKRRQGEETK